MSEKERSDSISNVSDINVPPSPAERRRKSIEIFNRNSLTEELKIPLDAISTNALPIPRENTSTRPKSLMHKRTSSHLSKLSTPLDITGTFEDGGIAVTSSPSSAQRRTSNKFVENSKRNSIDWLDDIADKIKVSIPLSEHKHMLRTYKNSFTGEGLCCWLRGSGISANLAQCIEAGQGLLASNMIHCIDGSKEFKFDSSHIYQFVEKPNIERRTSSNTLKEESKSFDELKLTSSTPINDVLDHPEALLKLERFCEKEHNAENLHFWASVVEYRNQLDSIQALTNASAEIIIDHYVRIGAKQQVNIPATMREELIDNFKKGATASLFDKAADEIFHVMRKDAYSRFLKAECAGEKPVSPK